MAIFVAMKSRYNRKVTVLGIESSCDDTAASVCADGKILSNVVSSQEVHKNYGGVVPELASRAHLSHIVPVMENALQLAEVELSEIDAIAFTQGPGLLGSLIVGVQFAKGLSLSLGKPLIGINHMEAHIMAHFIEAPKPRFPFLNLTVSGGHTELIIMKAPFDQELIGQTLDDAAGEAFDKCGKMMNLSYPSGPEIDQLAQSGSIQYSFPKAKVGQFDFSFSGLKTAVLYFLRDQLKIDQHFIKKNRHNIAASVQHAIVEPLVEKTINAALEYKLERIAISGGVSVNSYLRERMSEACQKNKIDLFLTAPQYSTDNAAMIAMAGYFKFLEKTFTNLDCTPDPRLLRKGASEVN